MMEILKEILMEILMEIIMEINATMIAGNSLYNGDQLTQSLIRK